MKTILRIACSIASAVLPLFSSTTQCADPPSATTLFDFEEASALDAWSNLVLPDQKLKEPAVKIERAAEHASSGKQALKLTFAGGQWPTITTTAVDDAWLRYQTFEADVFASRPCLVGFTVMQEKSQRGDGWEPVISRWTKTAFLQPGANHVTASLPQPNDYALHAKWGEVVRFEIFMYRPHEGETIYVDQIRLTNDKLPQPTKTTFALAGTDHILSGKTAAEAVIELGKKLKDKWGKPAPQTAAQVEAELRTQFSELKKTHPRAVLAVLRDGEKGFDPTAPEKVYAGWKDAYFNSHGPDGMYTGRAENRGKSATHEVFMRHRSPLMRVDLSSIPQGADILAARLIVVRASPAPSDRDPEKEPTMWVVEPCNRPWNEYEVNAFEFAKDKFWQAVGGMAWESGGDFEPTFLAYGPSQVPASAWDFAHAVRDWTDGKHPNDGFMLHGDSHDYMQAYTREAEKLADRPAVIVIYEPK